MIVLNVTYSVLSLMLAAYVVNALVLLVIYVSGRHKYAQRLRSEFRPVPESQWPTVTVQLPVYNEVDVIARLIKSACNLDYPADKLQIQVVDDSTDETTLVAAQLVKQYQNRGVNICLVHRTNRVGFKGGALREALNSATGEFIAIFDSDFVPRRDFLKSMIPYLVNNPELGVVQSRWGHLNLEYSANTRAQALGIDAHFAVEQTARSMTGLYMNFNGSGGILRREAILDAGNWQDDTVCEDLDLSYRAQLKGWKILYVPYVVSPAELPAQVLAFKRQQFRWAKGSIQCAMKLWRSVIHAPASHLKRASAILHLTSYCTHLLLIASLLVLVPQLLWDARPVHWLAMFPVLTLIHPAMLVTAQATMYPDWKRRLLYLPIIMFLGTGLAVNSVFAIHEALTKRNHTFLRTPKFDLRGKRGQWHTSRYVLKLDRMFVFEILLGIYAIVGIIAALNRGNYGTAAFVGIYAGGFIYIALAQLLQSLRYSERSWGAIWDSIAHPKKSLGSSRSD